MAVFKGRYFNGWSFTPGNYPALVVKIWKIVVKSLLINRVL